MYSTYPSSSHDASWVGRGSNNLLVAGGESGLNWFTWHSVQIRKRCVFPKTLSLQCWNCDTNFVRTLCCNIPKTTIINVHIFDVCEMNGALWTRISWAVLNLHNYASPYSGTTRMNEKGFLLEACSCLQGKQITSIDCSPSASLVMLLRPWGSTVASDVLILTIPCLLRTAHWGQEARHLHFLA